MGLEKLLGMQKQLMEKVPHGVRREVYSEIMCAKDIIEKSILFLTSLGHKPWRPNPLPPEFQQERLRAISHSLDTLLMTHYSKFMPSLTGEEYEVFTRRLIASFGVIEETLEYLDSYGKKEANSLEEITDILFFYLELIILGGFTWQEIEEEYVRKHAENLERYRRAKEGDYGWNQREKGEL